MEDSPVNRLPASTPVLVTGATGFIGGHLCRRLVRDGCEVLATGRAPALDLPGVRYMKADLTRPDEIQALMEAGSPAVIFHLASCVVGRRDRDMVRPTFEANLASTVYLMEAAASQACQRFILTGSLEEPQHVQDPPSSPYAAAKAAATAYTRMFHALYQFPAVIARVFMVYGPDQKDDKKLVPYVINSLLEGASPRMSSGTRMVDWIYVEDVVEGLIRMAATDGLDGQTVDLGTGHLTSVRGAAECIGRLMNAADRLHFDPAADRPMEQVRAADITRTHAQLGWHPATALEDGLAATIAWHRQQRNQP